MIRLEQVTKVYDRAEGPVHALAGVDLAVERGEFVAVQGPSGCGKSTLLAIVGALSTPTSGRVVVGGRDLAELSNAQRAAFRASQIGFVFQMFHLLPYLTVLDNVALAVVNGADAQAAARSLLERFGLGDRLQHRPAELSAGQCQRAAVARALVNRPPLVLADEPTGNLDAASAAEVLDLFADYHASGGTVLLVTHDASAAGRAQRSVHLARGAIASENR